jgi:hypothetical protein
LRFADRGAICTWLRYFNYPLVVLFFVLSLHWLRDQLPSDVVGRSVFCWSE